MVIRVSDKKKNYSKVTKLLVKPKENDYYRLQAFLENEIVFFANPIHCKERIEESMMFQEILNKFEK